MASLLYQRQGPRWLGCGTPQSETSAPPFDRQYTLTGPRRVLGQQEEYKVKQEVKLLDGGVAQYMGDDVFVLVQQSEKGPQSVAVTVEDLRNLLAQVEA